MTNLYSWEYSVRSSDLLPMPCSVLCSVVFNSLQSCGLRALGSSVPRISQARVVAWVAISYYRGSAPPRDWTHVSYISSIADSLPTEPPWKPVPLWHAILSFSGQYIYGRHRWLSKAFSYNLKAVNKLPHLVPQKIKWVLYQSLLN